MIYLYIKQHTVTKLKYFGMTEKQKNPFKYLGSGGYWKNHIDKHGKEHVETLEIWGFDDQCRCTEFALKFSKDNNIVESKEWANKIPEDGVHRNGFPKGKEPHNKGKRGSFKHTPESIEKIRNSSKGRIFSEESRIKKSKSLLGNTNGLGKHYHTEKSKAAISYSNSVREISDKTRLKHSNTQKGRINITDGIVNFKIKKHEQIPEGFRRGITRGNPKKPRKII